MPYQQSHVCFLLLTTFHFLVRCHEKREMNNQCIYIVSLLYSLFCWSMREHIKKPVKCGPPKINNFVEMNSFQRL